MEIRGRRFPGSGRPPACSSPSRTTFNAYLPRRFRKLPTGQAKAQEGPMTTVWIYVDTNKEVGDVNHLKVFATSELADEWFKENDAEGVAFEYEVLESSGSAPNDPCHPVDRGVGDHVEFVSSIKHSPPA
jgi:hypothetical protein